MPNKISQQKTENTAKTAQYRVLFVAGIIIVIIATVLGYFVVSKRSSDEEAEAIRGTELTQEQITTLNAIEELDQEDYKNMLMNKDTKELEANLKQMDTASEEYEIALTNIYLVCRANLDVACIDRYIAIAEQDKLTRAVLAGHLAKESIYSELGEEEKAAEQGKVATDYAQQHGLTDLLEQGGEM